MPLLSRRLTVACTVAVVMTVTAGWMVVRWQIERSRAGPCAHRAMGDLSLLPETAVRHMLMQQAADWNRGDLPAFASGYKNSPDILFIGHKTSRGYDAMLAAYKQSYSTREAMGTLTFSDLEVQPLDAAFATATGRFHLQRTTAGGGNADGYFLLVVEKTSDGWKIVRDDTTATPALPASPAAH